MDGFTGDGFLSVYLQVADDDAESLPSGWSQHANYSLTLVSQRNEMYNFKKRPASSAFKAGESSWGYAKFLKLNKLNDTSKGYIVHDTLTIKCDMTNICSIVSSAAASAATAVATSTTRIDVPAGTYPAGTGGLLYIPAGALASNKEPVGA